MENLGPWCLVGPWGIAAMLACLPRALDHLSRAFGLAGAAATAGGFTLLVSILRPGRDPVLLAAFEWLPGHRFEWSLDGLGALFGLLTVWIGLLVTAYSWHYLPRAQAHHGSHRREAAFYALIAAFTAGMLGLVTSGHLVQLYFFWELTGVWSFLLIGFWHGEPKARQAAELGLTLTVAGGLCLLVGLLLLGTMSGRWTIGECLALVPARSDIVGGLSGRAGEAGEVVVAALPARAGPVGAGVWWFEASAALILIGALAKSAQVPFLNWLPAAMAAPTPVSAFLHSAALVAAGVFVVARFFPLLSHASVWHPLLIGPGIAGMLMAGALALRQDEFKALLAHSTVAQYSFMFVGFGLGSPAGAQAGLYAFYVHAMIKAGLFMVAGSVTHLTGLDRLDQGGGLARGHPYLGVVAAILALALGGVPLLGGFYYKEELLHAAHDAGADGLVALMLLGGMITLLYMLRFLHSIFRGRARPAPIRERLPATMAIPMGLLAGLAATAGILPARVNALLLDPALSALLQQPVAYRVELNLGGVTVVSLAVLAVGGGLWFLWYRERVVRQWLSRLPQRLSFGGEQIVAAWSALGDRAVACHDGNLRMYLRWILFSAAGLVAFSWSVMTPEAIRPRGSLDPDLTLLLALAIVANLATIWVRHHVMAALVLAIGGFSLGGVFARLHAPDVALAQILVETLATISIALALQMTGLVHPERTTMLTAGRRDWRRWALAAGGGTAVALGTVWASQAFPENPAAAWYAAMALERTGMSDIVTAIVTEFRGLDTAIEILVFATAGLAVIGLFGKRREAADPAHGRREEQP